MQLEPLGEILSEDFWISPSDAREALDAVRRSVQSFDTDMRQAAAALPPSEQAEWAKWKRQFDEYYKNVTGSFLGWRLVDSTGVLAHAEQMAGDLNAWRGRFRHFTNRQPAAPGPVRTHVGPVQGPASSMLSALAAIGAVALAWRIYKDLR